MQIKTVEKIIKNKMLEWLETITDIKLKDSVKKNLFVSGGCITSLLLNEQVNDYDVYLMDRNVCLELVKYYVQNNIQIELLDGHFKKSLIESFNSGNNNPLDKVGNFVKPINGNSGQAIALRTLEDEQIKLYFSGSKSGLRLNEDKKAEELNYEPIFLSPNAISLSNNIQVVFRFFGTPEEIHKTFDFVHATNYFTFDTGLVRNLNAIESILTKQLRYNGSLYPVTSIIRAKKFTKRGFNISAGELLKIIFQVSRLDLTNPDILQEQLIGIDVAYFDIIITMLRNELEANPQFQITAEYINELIDKVFNETNLEES